MTTVGNSKGWQIMRRGKSVGLTRIEALVIAGCLTILLCLALPAILASLESSRRTSCKNNLRELGLAFHNYHDAHRVFPPGITSWNDPVNGRYCEYVATSSPCIPSSLKAPASNSSALTLLLVDLDWFRQFTEKTFATDRVGTPNPHFSLIKSTNPPPRS